MTQNTHKILGIIFLLEFLDCFKAQRGQEEQGGRKRKPATPVKSRIVDKVNWQGFYVLVNLQRVAEKQEENHREMERGDVVQKRSKEEGQINRTDEKGLRVM